MNIKYVCNHSIDITSYALLWKRTIKTIETSDRDIGPSLTFMQPPIKQYSGCTVFNSTSAAFGHQLYRLRRFPSFSLCSPILFLGIRWLSKTIQISCNNSWANKSQFGDFYKNQPKKTLSKSIYQKMLTKLHCWHHFCFTNMPMGFGCSKTFSAWLQAFQTWQIVEPDHGQADRRNTLHDNLRPGGS